MGRGTYLLVLFALCSSCRGRGVPGSDDTTYTVTGFFGCRFSSVCTEGEICIDDALFGNCQNPSRAQGVDQHQYQLTPDYLKLIIGQLENLVAQEYAWDNLYTQCVVGNLLLSYRVGEEPDLTFCDPKPNEIERESESKSESEGIDPEILALLQKLIYQYDNDEETEDVQKREDERSEFVKVHKYLKERKSSLPETDVEKFLAGMSMKDLVEMKDYLSAMKDLLEQDGGEAEAEAEAETDAADWPERGQVPEWLRGEEEEPSSSWTPNAIGMNDVDGEESSPEVEKKTSDFDDDQFITPDEAKMIFDLIDGKELPPNLSETEIQRLTEAVATILLKVRNEQEAAAILAEQGREQDDEESGPGPLTAEQMTPGGDLENEGDFEQVVEPESEEDSLKKVVLEEPEEAEKRSEKEVEVQKDVANAGPGYQIVHEPQTGAPAPDSAATVAPPDTLEPNVVTDAKAIYVDARYVFVEANRSFKSEEEALRLLGNLQYKLRLSPGSFSDAKIHDDTIVFRVNENDRHLNATSVAKLAGSGEIGGNLMNDLQIVNAGTRKWADLRAVANSPKSKYLVLAFVVCGCVAGTVLAILAIYLVRRHSQSRQKLRQIGDPDSLEASKDYQDLCRQRMQSKASEKPEPLHAQGRVSSVASEPTVNSPSSRSSTSSCYASTSRDAQLSEEPVTTNMDITTGHIILSYMEDHLQNKDRLHEEWDELSNYVPDLNQTDVASNSQNARQNRYADILPYDHSRVVLNSVTNILDSDYINASTITDHDPRNPAYIATQGPLPHTVADFWQMIWEQGSVVIVMLTKLTENGNTMCHRYWPEEGSDLYHIYEVHLVSEHIWCDDYLVRSFYLKNLQTNETRTVTQFHFLTWPDLSVPSSAKALLDFRRKVNKSYKGRSCPIVVHCSDGAGRTGIYCLIDMVLSRMSKGAKEIDIAATLEHIRDQRMSMVKTKEQFEFALTAVAEEVHAILKALPQ